MTLYPVLSNPPPWETTDPFNNDIINCRKALWKQFHFMTYVVSLGSIICYLGEFVKNKTHGFQCFSMNGIII